MGAGMANDLIEKLYNNSPIWLQNIMVSIKGGEYRYRRVKQRIMAEQLAFLLESEHWNTDQIRTYQGQQLRKLLQIAFKQVPYYRELRKNLGCKVEDFQLPEDIKQLPILEKSQLRGQEQLFINEAIDLKKCTKGFTSGTTGTPLNLYYLPEEFSQEEAIVARLRRWAGLREVFFPKRAQFTGRNIIPPNQGANKPVYWRWNLPGNSLLFSTTHISPETVPYYIKALGKFDPELIDGYPSAILVITRISKRLKLELPKPKAIIVSAETLWPEHRREIEEAFHCQVFNLYSGSEPAVIWCDCQSGQMHENPEVGISEIVDENGNQVLEGGTGEVVSTSFLNTAMILIRYRIGDMAVRGPSTLCKCGRTLPRIEKVEGRTDDILYVPERGYVGRLDPVFKGLSNIIEAQIIQEDLNLIRVSIVPDDGFNQDIEIILEKNMRAKLGQEVKIAFQIVNRIPRGARGKFNSVLSKVKHLYPDKL
jgi:phenylacetate-CoA ligase